MVLHFTGRVSIYGYADRRIFWSVRVIAGRRPSITRWAAPLLSWSLYKRLIANGRFLPKRTLAVTHFQVFDPPMCCSSGACGPAVNPVLPQFAADLDWLKSQGVKVERYGLSQQPNAFAETDAVQRALSSEGTNCLPLVLVNGQIVSCGTYPIREELASFAGLVAQTENIYTGAVEEDHGSVAGGCCGSDTSLNFISAKKGC